MCDTSALLVLGSVCFANIYLDFKNDLWNLYIINNIIYVEQS